MKFRVDRDAFSEAVQWTARVLPNRPTVPILAGIRLSVADESLSLSSFDYEVSARAAVEADVEEPGEVLIPGKLLAEISRSLPNRTVNVSLADNHVAIQCGNAAFSLNTMSLDDYPQVPAQPKLQGTVDSAVFAQAIQQVVIAASSDDSLPLLTGTQIEVTGNKMTLMATDRYRLSLREIEWMPKDPSIEATVLVKSKVLTEVARAMSSAGEIELHLTENDDTGRSSIIGFSAGTRQSTSILMDGDYPPVRRLFPEVTPLEYSCNRLELLEAVRRVSLVAERNSSVRLTFADGYLLLEAGQGDNAQAQESVEMISDAEELKTAFNPDYLQNGLSVCDTEFVRFGFTHPTKAAVMEGQPGRDEPADKDFRYLLMPIRFGV